MNNEAEAIKQLLAWLLQEPNPTISAPSGDNVSRGTVPESSEAVDLQLPYLDPLDSEEVDAMLTDLCESGSFSKEEISSLEPGDIAAVQNRFHTLLKRRLRAEIERNPPRFPWETGVHYYETDYSEQGVPGQEMSPLWMTQLQLLDLPISMPDGVLAQLFEQCQTVVQSALQEGAKLVEIVEVLFPGQGTALNQLAGLVLTSPSRSGRSTPSLRPQPADLEASGFPSHYEGATPAQQMVLSLLAARELLQSMSLTLSSEQPTLKQSWLTEKGKIWVEATYQPQLNCGVRIQGYLPCAGQLCLQTPIAQASSQRAEAGYLSLELFNLQVGQVYPLEVYLEDLTRSPLVFAVQIQH